MNQRIKLEEFLLRIAAVVHKGSERVEVLKIGARVVVRRLQNESSVG